MEGDIGGTSNVIWVRHGGETSHLDQDLVCFWQWWKTSSLTVTVTVATALLRANRFLLQDELEGSNEALSETLKTSCRGLPGHSLISRMREKCTSALAARETNGWEST